jgi:capsular polysaccharide biosynthesis protein
VIIFLVIALIATFIQPLRYAASTKLLVLREAPAGIDPYQVSRANNYTSEVLANVVETNSFLNQVLASDQDINADYFAGDQKKRLEKWQDTVKADTGSGGGVINITVLHPDRLRADRLVRAVNQVLLVNHSQYHGSEAVSLMVINEPYTSDLPASPNVIWNIALGLAIGLLFGLSYIYLFPENTYDLRIWPGGRKSKQDKSAYQDIPYDLEKGGLPVEKAAHNSGPGHSEYSQNKDDLDYVDFKKRGDIQNVFRG